MATKEKQRERVQGKSKEIGHCCCSPIVICPCNYFKKYDICKCAGEPCDTEEWVKINSLQE